MAKQEITHEGILKELKDGVYRPVYYLMGEEPYFIDIISDYIAANVLSEAEKEFNQIILYGADVEIGAVINTAKRYPMMSKYQIVIVREAQNIKKMDDLIYYLQKPLTSTILVICHKNGVLDRRKKLATEIEKVGVLFESKKIRENMLPAFITSYMKQRKVDVDSKAAHIISDFVGNDLSRLTGELNKLIITMPQGETRVTPDLVEKNIGISKDFNNFELKNALLARDIFKANQIVKYFEDNPKSNPIQVTLSMLFNFYSNLMLAYYAPVKNEQGVAGHLGLRSPWQAREYIDAMTKYNGVKVMQIIGHIRYCDAMSKGVGNSSVPSGQLLRELVYQILH